MVYKLSDHSFPHHDVVRNPSIVVNSGDITRTNKSFTLHAGKCAPVIYVQLVALPIVHTHGKSTAKSFKQKSTAL
jgi:hypothetical protein